MSGTLVFGNDVDIEDVDDMTGAYTAFCLGVINRMSDSNLTIADLSQDLRIARTIESEGVNRWWDSRRDLVTKWTISHGDEKYATMLSTEEFNGLMEEAGHEWKAFKAQAIGVELPLMEGWL